MAGTVINDAFLLANNPGTTVTLSDGLLPQLGRPSWSAGTHDHLRPDLFSGSSPTPGFCFDVLGGKAERKFDRLDMDWSVRNSNFMVPLNVKVDSNNVVTSGTFANAQFFLEARPYDETVDFFNLNPGMTWQIRDWVRVDAELNMSKSLFFRQAPTVLVNTPLGTGLTVTYDNNGSDGFPLITSNRDLNDPNSGDLGRRAREHQNERRVTKPRRPRRRHLRQDDGVNLSPSPTTRPAATSPPTIEQRRWQAFCGGGWTFGRATPPRPATASRLGHHPGPAREFLRPGPRASSRSTTRLQGRHQFDRSTTAPRSLGGHAAAPVSSARRPRRLYRGQRRTQTSTALDQLRRRYASTDQSIRGPQTVNGVTTELQRESRYDAFLPSFNAVYKVTGNINLRMAASRTLTRPNPSAMLPGTTFSDPSAQNANQGNPSLAPYTANNFDVGGEWYTGEGCVAPPPS